VYNVGLDAVHAGERHPEGKPGVSVPAFFSFFFFLPGSAFVSPCHLCPRLRGRVYHVRRRGNGQLVGHLPRFFEKHGSRGADFFSSSLQPFTFFFLLLFPI
jgi:hypothetical protein